MSRRPRREKVVRLSPDCHRVLKAEAAKLGMSMRQLVETRLMAYDILVSLSARKDVKNGATNGAVADDENDSLGEAGLLP